MRLYLDQDRYCCLGCGAKGDVVQWVRDAEDVGVLEALRLLDAGGPIRNAWAGFGGTRPAGVEPAPVADQDPPDLGRTPPERVRAALWAAWTYYTSPALHERGRRYLAERGIAVEVLEGHSGGPEVGHTPASPTGLVEALRARGFGPDELVDAGLARRRGTGEVTDYYRQRALVPLRDDSGDPIGFVGRNVGRSEYPKYVNPPRTVVYDKARALYVPLAVVPGGRVVIVEGTLDALAIAVAALRSGRARELLPVSPSGRELSQAQLRTVLALRPSPVVLGFDGDAAGRDSAKRYGAALARLGRPVEVTTLPDGHDPASWLAARGDGGLDAWTSAATGPRIGPGPPRRRSELASGRAERLGRHALRPGL